jgi:ParB/RepB/Spo0J family partition protein
MDSIKLEPQFERKGGKVKGVSNSSDSHLLESIRSVGMREPFVVLEKKGEYLLVKGYRRYQVIKDLFKIGKLHMSTNINALPCVVISDSTLSSATIRLSADIRQDLTPSQEAFYYQKLTQEFNVTKKDLAMICGITPASIGNYLVILKCIAPVRKSIDCKQLPMSAGKIFCVLKPEGQQLLYNIVKRAKKIDRKTLVNQRNKLADDLFIKPKKDRMKVSQPIREKKKGQVQDGRTKRDLLVYNLSTVELEHRRAEKDYEIENVNLQHLVGWWDIAMRHESIKTFIQHKYPSEYDNIKTILSYELGVDL